MCAEAYTRRARRRERSVPALRRDEDRHHPFVGAVGGRFQGCLPPAVVGVQPEARLVGDGIGDARGRGVAQRALACDVRIGTLEARRNPLAIL